MRHEARLDKPDDKGVPQRKHLEGIAHKSAEAQRLLACPPYPESLEYLWDWSRELVGRSGMSQYGVARLSYDTLEAWGRINDRELSTLEVEALFLIDSAMLNPGEADG